MAKKSWWQSTWFWVLSTLALIGGMLAYVFGRRGDKRPTVPSIRQKEEEDKANKEHERIEAEARSLTERIQEQAVEERRVQVEKLKREAELAGNADKVNAILADVSKDMR